MGLGAAGTAAAIGAAGAAASAGSSLASSSNAAGATKSAAAAQTAASNSALAQQQAQFAYSQGNELPYIGAGQVAQQGQNALLQQYEPVVDNLQNQLIGLGSSATAQNFLEQTPGYAFTLQQGLKSTANAAAARGLGVSGAALKGAANYATGLANSTYQSDYADASNNLTQANNTFQGLFGDYGSQASLGENASVGAGNQGQQASNNTSNLLTGEGNSVASSQIAGANALTSGVNGVTNSLTGALNNPAVTNYLASLSGNGSQYGSSANAGDGLPQTPQSGYNSNLLMSS